VPSKSATAKKPSPDALSTDIEEAAMDTAPATEDSDVAGETTASAESSPAGAPEADALEADELEADEIEGGVVEAGAPEAAAPIAAAKPANDPTPVLAKPVVPPQPGIPRHPGGIPGRVMPPPRPMAKAEQFAEGDYVVYPTHGVGKVERIATEEIAGHKLELIHITFEENRMTLRVPVTKARTAGLRKLATRKVFDDAMTVLKGRARIKRTMWSRRAQEYEAKINSGDPLSIAEVVRDLHRNAGQPDQSFSERQIYEAAMDRLAAELAALERIDKAAASVKLVEFLKTV
jgi:CarD family transcriptional regulator